METDTNLITAEQAASLPQNLASLELNALLLSGGAATVAAKMGPEHIPALRSLVREAEAAFAPISEEAAVVMLTKLFSHYPAQNTPAAVAKLRWDDWLDDMADVPADVLAAGCKAWRRSANKWAPSPGQLLQVMAVTLGYRRAYLARARAVLADLEAR